jgi:hypothetical protein
MAPKAIYAINLIAIRQPCSRKMHACQRCIHGDLGQSYAQHGFALGKMRGEAYSVKDGATDAYLHVLPKDLPTIQRTTADAVLDAISAHVFYPVACIGQMQGRVSF